MTTSLDTRSKDTILGTIAAGMQGRLTSVFLNFAKGKVFRALGEAYAGVSLWLQKEFITVLALTRASTSNNDDLDSWMADYGLARLPARASTGLVAFGRYTAAGSAPLIPNGTQVRTGDGTLTFAVYPDPTNGAYSANLGGYVLLAGAASVNVPVACITPGVVGNVAAGAISLVASSVPGVDTAANPAGFSNGLDAESDPAYRARFVQFIASLAKATRGALAYAIASLQQGLNATFLEFQQPDGTANDNFNTVFVDDGSGNPSSDLVAAAAVAVNGTRAFGIRVGVFGASTLAASVQMTVEIATGYYAPDVVAAVTAALSVYINGLPLGAKLRFTRLEQIAYDASPGVTNVTNVTLNGGAVDLVPTAGQTVKVSGSGGLVVSQAA